MNNPNTYGSLENDDQFTLSMDAIRIGEAAITGALFEVGASPAPGLVSPNSNGAHDDMNFFTFLRSTSSIAYAFYACAEMGIRYEDGLLERLRAVGIDAEKRMMATTCNVNTHRGLLFLMGILCASAGSCIRLGKLMNRENISHECAKITKGIVERELECMNKRDDKLSNGERLYKEHEVKGIRGEVEAGIPSVIKIGLPIYEQEISGGLSQNDALIHTLIGIMTEAEDTVVINRAGISGLEFVKNEAKLALELGGMRTDKGKKYIFVMDEEFKKRNISPGGAADLLAATVMIYELEKQGK